MSVEQYPKQAYFLYHESANLNLGSFKSVTGLLTLFQLRLLHKNSSPYSYQMRVVFSATEGGTALVSTDWETFSNATTGQVGDIWLGDVVFDVDEYRLNSSSYLHARLETTGFTPNGTTVYLAAWCDWLEPIGNFNSPAARMTMGVKL